MSELSLIYGIRALIEAIKSEENIDKIFVQREQKSSLNRELDLLIKKNRLNVSYVPVEKLNKLTSNNHQGVVAKISPIEFVSLDNLVSKALKKQSPALFILLDQISDVRNFGAIIRTAECTGVDGIIIQKKGGAPINADTIKTSAGAVFNIPICKVDHIKDAIFYLQGSDIKIIAATERSDKNIYDISFKDSCAIVMGSEGRGINPSVLKLVDEKAKLPILGNIDSLNVSVACGAILYEVVRQRL